MESDATALVISRAAANFTTFSTQDQERSWKWYWSKFWCFGPQKRGNKQIVPSSNPDGTIVSAEGWVAGESTQANLSLAPPSSPASIVNSSIQSPACFILPLSAASEPAKLMYTIGPYAHETQLVSPPAFSTFTTEPSTGSLTPHPELANMTTPASPEVPFAQLVASSLEAKSHDRKRVATTLSPLSLESPSDYTPGEPKAPSLQDIPDGELVFPAWEFLDSRASSASPAAHFAAWESCNTATTTFTSSDCKSVWDAYPTVSYTLPEQEKPACINPTFEHHHDHLVELSSRESCAHGLPVP